jgi:uncharacterized SAM-binding protein YcdF (DUF218 family)
MTVKTKKFRIYLVAAALGVLLFVTFGPNFFLKAVGSGLVKERLTNERVDGVVLLMGEPLVRVKVATALIEQKISNKLYFIKSQTSPIEEAGFFPEEGDVVKTIAESMNIKSEQLGFIESEGRVTSTVDEAMALRRYFLKTSMPKSLILVTSWYHTRRTYWIFSKVFDDHNVDLYIKAASIETNPTGTWWNSEQGLVAVALEYIKFARYLYIYGFRDI